MSIKYWLLLIVTCITIYFGYCVYQSACQLVSIENNRLDTIINLTDKIGD